MTEFSMRGKAGSARWAITGLGAGAGVTIVVIVARVVAAHPELLKQMLDGGVLYFSILAVGMVVFEKRFQQFNASSLRGAVANEQLALNVGALVSKLTVRDEAAEQRAREQEILLNHNLRQVNRMAEQIDRVAQQNESIMRTLAEGQR